MYPDAPLIKREGEVNAWDNEDFRAAIKATNRTQIIIAGIVTDVCMCYPTFYLLGDVLIVNQGTAFLARSLRAEGYSVWANLEASGTTTKEVSTSLIPYPLYPSLTPSFPHPSPFRTTPPP